VAVAQTLWKDLGLSYGTYQVGFRHYVTFDHSRSYQRQSDWDTMVTARPMAISVWYPTANAAPINRLKVQDYMQILKEEEEWERLPNDKILSWFYYADTEVNRKHMALPTKAVRQAQVHKGKFPVVIYAPSYQASSIENFALCEFLASHGYVVLASPSRGTESRPLAGGTTRDLETQVGDIQFLIGQSAQWPFTDKTNLAVAGFSFGGMSNVLAQMKDSRVKALVCLDGSVRYQLDKLLASPYADLSKVKVPFLFMAQKDIPLRVMEEDNIDTTLNSRFAFFDSLRYSQAYFLKFHDLTHSYFSSLGVLFQTRDLRQDKSDSAIIESYRWVNRYTLQFLNACLKANEQSKQFLARNPVNNHAPDQLVTILRKVPLKRALSFEAFHGLAKKQRYQNLDVLINQLKQQYPGLVLEEWKLNNLGLQLLFKRSIQPAISILNLATTLYPQSGNVYDSLAEGYLVSGNKEQAAKAFQRSLELDSHNQNAIDQLRKLRNK
jgi:dienelactone hydrolase